MNIRQQNYGVYKVEILEKLNIAPAWPTKYTASMFPKWTIK